MEQNCLHRLRRDTAILDHAIRAFPTLVLRIDFWLGDFTDVVRERPAADAL